MYSIDEITCQCNITFRRRADDHNGSLLDEFTEHLNSHFPADNTITEVEIITDPN